MKKIYNQNLLFCVCRKCKLIIKSIWVKPRKIKNSQDDTNPTRYQDFKNATVIKILYYWHRDKQIFQWNRISKLKTDLSKCRSLMSKRTTIIHQLGKGCLCRYLFIYLQRRKRRFAIIISCLFILFSLYLDHISIICLFFVDTSPNCSTGGNLFMSLFLSLF